MIVWFLISLILYDINCDFISNPYLNKTNYIVCFKTLKKEKRKKKVFIKPFKNPNSSLFQNKTSGIHQFNLS